MLSLSISEIIDLAHFAGLPIDYTRLPKGDDLNIRLLVIKPRDSRGVWCEDEGRFIKTDYVAYVESYPEEGCFPLGPEVDNEVLINGLTESETNDCASVKGLIK